MATKMAHGRAALTFAQWGTPPETVPHYPPGSYHSPSRLLSQARLVKNLSFAAYAAVGQSVTERYNVLVEPGLPVYPLQGGPAFFILHTLIYPSP
jgi:hypothetical protein